MKRSAFLLALFLLLLLPLPAKAQEPEPTPTPVPTATPTPAYMQDVPLSSGNTLHVVRQITYGEAAVVVALLVLWVTLLVSLVVIVPKLYLGGR